VNRRVVAKMHGARNDFVVIDTRESPVADAAALAVRLCDRHAGIGADGLLLVGGPSSGADVAMRVINPDGSEAEMCGNGIRCVARFLDERGEGGEHDVATSAGVIRTSVVERGESYRVRVDMGIPRVVEGTPPIGDAVVVDTGNPHIVIFRDSLSDIDLSLLGSTLQRHSAFENGVNVHVVTIHDQTHLAMRHYERGAGLTMACGTGAVAAVAAARFLGRVKPNVDVRVPGGDLRVEIDASGRAFMTGPAVHVFDTTVE